MAKDKHIAVSKVAFWMKNLLYFVCIIAGLLILKETILGLFAPLFDKKPPYESEDSILVIASWVVYYIIILFSILVGYLLTKFGVHRLIGKKINKVRKRTIEKLNDKER